MHAEENSRRVPAMVVGVDGSAGAAAALRWALGEARLRKAPLRVVHAWTNGYSNGGTGGFGSAGGLGLYAAVSIDLDKDLQRTAETLLDTAIAEVAGDVGDVEIERLAIEGGAGGVLVGAVTAGELLVVGTRGHGGFAGLLLGSVSHQCIHHAPCPVVVVHPPTVPTDRIVPVTAASAHR